MRRKYLVISLILLGVMFIMNQFHEIHSPNEKSIQKQRGKIIWKFTQKEIDFDDDNFGDSETQPTLTETTVPETPDTNEEEPEGEPEEQQETKSNTTKSNWYLFDLPYPPPAKRRTDGPTRTTHLPIPDDSLVSTFRQKYKEYHDNKFTGNKRFIVWTKVYTWGLGNCIEGIITTILVGLLTDRAILLDDPLISSMVDWPWTTTFSEAQGKAFLNGPKYAASNDECYFLEKGFGRDYEWENFDTKWTSDVLFFECNCPGFHWIAKNPLYFEKLRRLGILPPESSGVPKEDFPFYVATWISKMFFGKTKPLYQASIDKYVNSWNAEKAFVIGFQIRMGGNGDATFMTNTEVDVAITCAQEMAKGHTNVKYLVASDSAYALEKISSAFGEQNVIIVSGTPKHIAFQQKIDNSDVEKLLADNWLLSEVDELIITPQSTFGAIAAFRGGKLPMYVLYQQCLKATADYGPGGHWEGMLLCTIFNIRGSKQQLARI